MSDPRLLLLVVLLVLLVAASALSRSASVLTELLGDLLRALFANLRALAVVVLLVIGVVVVLLSSTDPTTAVGLLVGRALH